MNASILPPSLQEAADRLADAMLSTKPMVDYQQVKARYQADPELQARIEEAAASLNLKTMRLPSGAGHDAQWMARLAPMGMIFVPSAGGISHSPKEFSRPKDIENGANVLLHTVLAVDTEAK